MKLSSQHPDDVAAAVQHDAIRRMERLCIFVFCTGFVTLLLLILLWGIHGKP